MKVTPVMLTWNCAVPAPCLVKVPALLKTFVPPKPKAFRVNAELAVKLPLLLKVPPVNAREPLVQLAVPSFCSTRFRSSVLPLRFSAAPAETIVVPLPDIVPDVQLSVALIVTFPDPASVPPERFKLPSSEDTVEIESVPPERTSAVLDV